MAKPTSTTRARNAGQARLAWCEEVLDAPPLPLDNRNQDGDAATQPDPPRPPSTKAPKYGPDHPFYYHRQHGNHVPVPLDAILASAEAARSISDALSSPRERSLSRLEHRLARERKRLDINRERYQRLVARNVISARDETDDGESARAVALAKRYHVVSCRLARVTFLVGMLRRMIE